MKILKGLNISITGEPVQTINDDIESKSPKISTVAVIGTDYNLLRPSMLVSVGDHVKLGQALFTDKRNQGFNYTAPGAGVITEINRGAKRALLSIVIKLDENEEHVELPKFDSNGLDAVTEAEARKILQESGAWTAIRTRPYSKTPEIDHEPAGIFVKAIDTDPLSADPAVIINHRAEAFQDGLKVLAKLTKGQVHVCQHETASLPALPTTKENNVVTHKFSGKHPAGLVGTHIHHILPVSAQRSVWHLNYQDVIAIGKLFTTGKRFVDRIVALAGPMVKEPRLIVSRMGASTNEIVKDELEQGDARVISGSILNGQHALGSRAYIGRFSYQVSVVPEGQPRQFLHWVNPFLKHFSVMNVFTNSLSKPTPFRFSSSQNGSPRAMVPLGNYEAVMPLDILPTQLLRALLVRDTETAQKLGCLELDEEDLALCTFVCHSKYEYGPALRACLEIIEREG